MSDVQKPMTKQEAEAAIVQYAAYQNQRLQLFVDRHRDSVRRLDIKDGRMYIDWHEGLSKEIIDGVMFDLLPIVGMIRLP